ncbi:probable ergosterol biosynthetic protein 28, partial [Lingula anatina]
MKWDFVLYLRSWIGFVGLMAIGNTIQCFWDHQFLASRLYNGAPSSVNGLAARLFGVWTLLAGILRIWCAIFTYNRPLYDLTLFSFVLAFLHFSSEVFIF